MILKCIAVDFLFGISGKLTKLIEMNIFFEISCHCM
jgi:hypothetical protein